MPTDTTELAMPAFAIEYLLHQVPAKEFLICLKRDSHVSQSVFQGFEVKHQSLSLPPIRQRLLRLLKDDPKLRETALTLWKGSAPTICESVAKHSAKSLETDIEAMAKEWGGPAAVLALLADKRKNVRKLAEKLGQTLEGIPEPVSVKQEPDVTSASAAAVDAGATPRVQKLESRVHSLTADLHEAQRTRRKLEQDLRHSHNELDRTKKELTAAQGKAGQLEKAADKAQKMLNRVERARDQATQESENLKRELRHLKSQMTALSAPPPREPEADQLPPPPEAKVPEKKMVPVGADQVFRFQVDGLHYTLSVETMLRAIVTNVERDVREFSILLDRIRRADVITHRKILTALRKRGHYYPRVLTAPTTPAIVDGSNVAHGEKNQKGQAKLQNILSVREELRGEGFFPIWIYVDASLPHQVDNRAALEMLIKAGEIMKVQTGTTADDAITRHARDTGAYVVTNDRNIADAVGPSLRLDTIGFDVFNSEVTLKDW